MEVFCGHYFIPYKKRRAQYSQTAINTNAESAVLAIDDILEIQQQLTPL